MASKEIETANQSINTTDHVTQTINSKTNTISVAYKSPARVFLSQMFTIGKDPLREIYIAETTGKGQNNKWKHRIYIYIINIQTYIKYKPERKM